MQPETSNQNYTVMKKFTYYVGLALMALMPISQLVHADCAFTPNLFPGQAADRTALEVNATAALGDEAIVNSTIGSVINVQSTDANVVSVLRNRQVFFVGRGTTTVTYTETNTVADCASNHTIHYTVGKGSPTAYFRALDGSPANALTVGYTQSAGGEGGDASGGAGGGGTYVPGPVMQYKQFAYTQFNNVNIPTGEITYTSTNEAVATINEYGVISVKGLGVTTLSASWNGNDDWNAANATLALTVKKDPNLSFSPSLINDSVGKVIPLHVNTPDGVTISRWSSSNENIASVDNAGNVTLKLPGSANIYAEFDGNAEYAPGRCACQVNISKAWPRITFTPEVIRLEKGVGVFEAPEMHKPADLTETYSTTYEWSSYDPNGVASVNAQTGAVTLLGGTGTATIIYAFKGDARYLAENARYYIEVTTSGITVMGTYATSANNGDIFGDGSVIYRNENGDKYIELNAPEFDANGGVFIQSDVFLKVLVKQNCVIKNTTTAIECASAVFVWCENRKDTITINATQTGILAQEAKIHDCYLFANGGTFGINTTSQGGGLTVSAGGYVFASGNSEAIRTRQFTKGEDNIGGIEILTKDVRFVPYSGKGDYGFLTSTDAKAKFVELGKVPLPLKNNEVKDITFAGEGENPDENLDVVFSESKDDGYNEVEKQIEINTTTSDDKLSATLTAHVTCSADWLKALPGVLVFDVPEGSGKFEMECTVAAGFHVEAFLEGVGEAKIDSPKDGWIVVSYNVAKQTHVIIYLQADAKASAPAHAKAKKDVPGMAIKSIKITPGAAKQYYVIGNFTSWKLDDKYLMAINPANAAEYMLDVQLADTSRFKVVQVQADTINQWFPDLVPNYGEAGQITEAAEYTVYFRPDYEGGNDWYYKCIYVAKKEASGVIEVEVDDKAVKRIVNGQLFIFRGENVYTITGQRVK